MTAYINSLTELNGYAACFGLIAMMQQYSLMRTGKLLTQASVFAAINSTGKAIYDSSSGMTWYRLNALAALQNVGSVPSCQLNLRQTTEATAAAAMILT